jgi:ABC-type transporter Mla maintaining outer membrane lipid asymmetry permease subunit MlaE
VGRRSPAPTGRTSRRSSPQAVVISFLGIFAFNYAFTQCYYGYTASGGPVGVGRATAKSMVVNIVSVHVVGMLGTQLFWGANPRAPIGG